MGLDTQADVRDLLNVQDSEGDSVPPANENRQQEIVDAVGNPVGATIETHTTGSTNPEQLPDLSIPDGVTAAIVYLPGNSGDVFLGDSNAQFVALFEAGDFFAWEADTTRHLHIKTTNAGDGVGIIFEGAQ